MSTVCAHVEALLLDRPGPGGNAPQNLLINVPPGTSKSLILSVFAPAWMWLFRPTWRAMFASANPKVVTRDSLRCRELIRSEWYQRTFEPSWRISPSQDEKHLFTLTAGGSRLAIGAGAAVTGERADFLGCDDPNDAQAVHSKLEREAIHRWWRDAWHNRIANARESKRAVIMQRVHAEDLSGYLLDQEKGDWEHLLIRMEHERADAERKPTWLGWTDPRERDGELLHEARFPAGWLAREKVALGSSGTAGQLQQRPVAVGGNRFKREWWRFWSPTGAASRRPDGCSTMPPKAIDPAHRSTHFDRIVLSVDAAFKDREDCDWIVGLVLGQLGSGKYVLARERLHVDVGGTCRMVEKLWTDWGKHRLQRPVAVLIEDKANGPAVLQTLRGKIPAMIPIEPQGGKESRAAAIEPRVEAGDIYLPEGAEWLGEWVDEFADFPRGKHDDQVDALSQALIWMDDPVEAATVAAWG